MKKIAISLIRFYKNLSEVISAYQLSPFFYSGCRHYPTCSEYSILAIEKFGVMKGSYKAMLRILRCNPLSHKFYDPI